MRGIWLELLGEAWKTVAAGVIALAIIAIVGQPRDGEFSCGPTEEDEEEDDTAAWDRGHDLDVDRQTGVSP